MRSFQKISYGPFAENVLDLYLPEQSCFDLFLYIHGGGLESGRRDRDPDLYEYLTEKGVAVATIDYRMYPNAKYPDFVEDSALAAAWLKQNISQYGNCRKFFIGGSSAGGYLSMMLCFDRSWLAAHGLCAMDFDGFVHDAGQPTKHFNVLREEGLDTRRVIIDATAPLYHIGTDSDYPPMYFIVSDNDMKNRYEQTMLVMSTLRHFGFPEEKMHFTLLQGKHCHYLGKRHENGDSILGKLVLGFIQKCNGK